MAAYGTKQTSWPIQKMSAIRSQADHLLEKSDVGYCSQSGPLSLYNCGWIMIRN